MATLSGDADDESNNRCSCSSETNWKIAGGSLDTCITFESSDSPIDSDTVDAEGNPPPLILKPLSPDCGPCEIKINFVQKHEVRQVYVRSTARIYEIYFAPSLRSGSEYLCTVRCGIAARDDGVLHTATREPAGACSKWSAGKQATEKCSEDSNISTNEDDWIEVKVPNSPLEDNQHNSIPKYGLANPGANVQDLYEATADITDADACISLTLRLLSLQSKGCLYVDEIYVFADPVESAGPETQASEEGKSAGSSLMAMLVPTLLQLSKTGNDRRQDIYTSDSLEKDYLGVGPRVTGSNIVANLTQQGESVATPEEGCTASQQDVKLQEVNEVATECQGSTPGSDGEQKDYVASRNDVAYDHIERTLEKLVTRVSRIEDICLRFEENMLKPINSMEARLQRVEQQIEMLTKNTPHSGLPPCTRISAPAFSCIGSNSSSFYNEGSDYPACGVLELENNDIPSDRLSNPPNNMSILVNDTRFLPGLVVTAPEFSCEEDEENNDSFQPPEDSPREERNRGLSINGALAAALAGFISTASVQPSQYTRSLAVKAPEFMDRENDYDGKLAPPNAPSDKPIVPSIVSCESNGTECVKDSFSTSGSISVKPAIMETLMENLGDDFVKETPEGIDKQVKLDEEDTSYGSLGTSINVTITQSELEFPRKDDCQTIEEAYREEAYDGISVSASERSDTSEAAEEEAVVSAEDDVEVSEKGVLHDVLKSSSTSCIVDFELPILDVKFASLGTSGARSSLETLLTNLPEFDAEAPKFQQRDDDVIGDQSNLITLEDREPNCPPNSHPFLVDWDSRDVTVAASGVEGKSLEDSYACPNKEISESLI